MPRTYFPFYFTFYESAQTMKPKMRAAFYEAIIEYGVTGNKPTLPSSIAGYWPMIKKALDTSKQRYDAGEKGGKASKESRFGSNNKKNKDNENNKERENNKENDTAGAASEGATQQDRQDIFAEFAGTDSALSQALQDYDTMRQEKHKALTDTMRRSLCEQLNGEFQPCEWVAIIKQATLHGWMKFYALDEPKPQQSQQRPLTAEEEYTRLFDETFGSITQ